MSAIGLHISLIIFFGGIINSFAELSYRGKILHDYPLRSQIVVSLGECKVMPGDLKNYRVTSDTKIKIIKENFSLLEEGEVWGIINQEKLDHELRSLNYERKVYTQKVKGLKRTFDLKKEEILQKVAVIEEEKFKLLDLKEESDTSEQLQRLIKERLQLIEGQIKTLLLEIGDDEIQLQYGLELEALDLGIDKKERNYKELLKKSKMIAPFAGRLELNLNKAKLAPHEYEIEANTMYATITDDSRFELRMQDLNSLLKSGERDNYFVSLNLGGQRGEIRANYQGVRREAINGRLRKIGVFEVESESIQLAREVVEENYSVFIMKKLPERCHIVRKSDLALVSPDLLERKGWKGLIHELWAGTEVVEVGLYDIAVRYVD